MHRHLGRLLFQRHSPRSAWVYLLWILVAYAPIAILAVAVNEDHRILHSNHLFDGLFLLPVALAVWQAVYPTLCGWLVVTAPTILLSGSWALHIVYHLFKTRLHGFFDTQDFIGASIMCGAEVLVGIALIYARPRSSTFARVA